MFLEAICFCCMFIRTTTINLKGVSQNLRFRLFLTIFSTTTGCLVSKRHNVGSIYRVFELKMRKIKVICMFIGNGHLTNEPWIWLKVTSLSSTASVLKDDRIALEIPSFYSKKYFFKTSK